MAALDLFSEKSDLYALARPKYPQELYEFIASCVAQRDRVWDCATGNGQAAIALAKIFNEVHATDLSGQQISHAVHHENITYSVQPAEQTNFPDNYFDAITVAQAIHWFDYDKYWPEALRVLKAGGIFAAWGYDWFKISPKIDVVVDDTIMAVIKPYWAEQNKLVWDGYKNITFPFEKIAVPKIVMQQQWNLHQLLSYMHTWSATRQCLNVQGKEFFEYAAIKIEAVWGDPSAVKEIKTNFHLYAGRKLF